VLFCNHRLIDLPALKRSVQELYAVVGAPSHYICVLDLTVPGPQVDVNVHPSKRQVALMYQEVIVTGIQQQLMEALEERSFETGSMQPAVAKTPSVKNPYKKAKLTPVSSQGSSVQKKTPPSKLIRTSNATPVGAIRPFLVTTTTQPTQNSLSQSSEVSSNGDLADTIHENHDTTCPHFKIDLSQPGAFALPCTCRKIALPKIPRIRPKRVIPTPCSYSSIQSLRSQINKRAHADWTQRMRQAYFCGTVSHHRSLIQCGQDLVWIHHAELAQELFYQLALAKFGGGMQMGQLPAAINVRVCLEQALQLEEEMVAPGMQEEKVSSGLFQVRETNQVMAEQAAACLWEHATMLKDYFQISMEQKDDHLLLTGLPILLDGHTAQPHGLPIFLLRLATQVNWEEEKPCFRDICQELGKYYAMVPTNEVETHVRHILFPALSFLWIPSERHEREGNLKVLTDLSTLYKVFERC